MKIVRVTNKMEGGKKTFNLLKSALESGAKVLGLATGSTPETFYQELVGSDFDLSAMTSINLDEYVGLDASSDQSYATFMRRHLFDAKPFKENFLPNGKAVDLGLEVKRYDQVIADHPIDWQILGIGQNGHIGFNEPGTPADIRTHVVDLAPSTISANARFFDSEADVPKQAISMGLASIMESKQIVLLAFGSEKADAVKGMIEGPLTKDLPASLLQNHSNVTVVVDEAAASKLSDHY